MLKIIFPITLLIMLPSKFKIPLIHTSVLLLARFFIIIFTQFDKSIIYPIIHLDLISNTLIILTLWISALIIPARFSTFYSTDRIKIFKTTILFLNLILFIAFISSNLFIFFIFFEASLIPTIFLIIGWGYQPERLQAGIYLMLYTITASLPLLILIAMLYFSNFHSSFILSINNIPFIIYSSPTIFRLFLFLAFLVKLPLFLTHLWLPKAHVEAPVAGSIILAGLLLKLGGYGILRFIFIFPFLKFYLSTPLISISLIGGFITRIICIRQTDIKALIAYSSIGHIALLVLGSISIFNWGWARRLTIIIAHGLSRSALFFLSFTTYFSSQTRRISLTKGILSIAPILSLFWFIFSALNIAAPPSINLMSEIFLFSASFTFSSNSAIILILIRFLRAVYSLILYTSLNHGAPLPISNAYNSYFLIPYWTLAAHFIPALILILSPHLILFLY